MQKIWNKRILRDLKKNIFPYVALFLLIVLGMYLIISLVGAAENVIVETDKKVVENKVEDGEFTVFVPLTDNEIDKLVKTGITLEKEFYLNYVLEDESTVRVFKNRENVNLIDLDEGRLAEKDNEIVIEKHYAESKNLVVGSKLNIAAVEYTVTGIGSTPDYEYVLNGMADTTAKASMFGTTFVTTKQYEKLKKEGAFSKTEEYLYSYLLNGKMTADELKDILGEFELDRSQLKDTYFIEMLDELEGMKTDIQDGISELADGADELYVGLTELSKNNNKLQSGASDIFESYLSQTTKGLKDYGLTANLTEKNYESQLNQMITMSSDNALLRMKLKSVLKQLDSLKAYKDGTISYTEAVAEAAEGSKDLTYGVNELKSKTDELMDEYFDVDIDNLTQFVERDNNPRIGAAVDDVLINKYAGIVAGIIIIVLFTYVISVFVIHGIDKESSVIGALYALGVEKKTVDDALS